MNLRRVRRCPQGHPCKRLNGRPLLQGEGQVVDRDEHLLVRTAAFAPTPRPFEDVAVDANSVIAWAGLIDYVPRAEAAARAQAPPHPLPLVLSGHAASLTPY